MREGKQVNTQQNQQGDAMTQREGYTASETWRVMDGAILSDAINDYGNFIVVSCDRERTEQDDRRLRLIASAPELLSACRTLLKDMQMLQAGTWEPDEDSIEASIEVLETAIAKAEGRA